MKIETQSKYIAALLPFVGTEETRYYLNGINIKPVKSGGIALAATNGHIIGVIHDKDGEADNEYTLEISENDIFHRQFAHLFRKETSRDNEEGETWTTQCQEAGRFSVDGMAANVHDEKGVLLFSAPAIDVGGTFPAYKEIFFKCPLGTGQDFSVNAELLSSFGRASQILSGTVSPYVRPYYSQPTESSSKKWEKFAPLLVSINCPDFYGAIMPVRTSLIGFPESPLPEFLKEAA